MHGLWGHADEDSHCLASASLWCLSFVLAELEEASRYDCEEAADCTSVLSRHGVALQSAASSQQTAWIP